MSITLPPDATQTSWVIGNIQHSGWYRVNYDDNNWGYLIAQLNADHLTIHPIHRAQLIDDSFNLGRSEIVQQTLFFDISKYLVNEQDGLAFVPAFTGFNFMTSFIEDDYETFQLYKV